MPPRSVAVDQDLRGRISEERRHGLELARRAIVRSVEVSTTCDRDAARGERTAELGTFSFVFRAGAMAVLGSRQRTNTIEGRWRASPVAARPTYRELVDPGASAGGSSTGMLGFLGFTFGFATGSFAAVLARPAGSTDDLG